MDKKIIIVAIKVLDRIKESVRFQAVLSKNSKIIKTRFGFHELHDAKCSRSGLVILELEGTETECSLFIEELQVLRGIKVEVMSFI